MRNDNIILTVMNRNKYQYLMDTIPHRDILDLSIVYRYINETPDGGMCSIIINNNMMNKLEYSEEELYKIAYNNTMDKYPWSIEELDSHFYVLSNPYRIFGAAGAFLGDEISELANMYKRSLFILPSSVHEVFIMPDYGQEKEYLKSIVEDANQNVVKEKDVLSDNVYYYDFNDKTIKRI